MKPHHWIASAALLATVVATGSALAVIKQAAIEESQTAAASEPEPVEWVTAAAATLERHRPATTSIGTVLALRSITLRNELPGTISDVRLLPGDIVEAGEVLVALDVSVERAELEALEAQAALAETVFRRTLRLNESRAVSDEELDRARAERDVALAQVARTKAVIARKTIRAPFRARVGLADVHVGQYLNEGTVLTTLQGVDDAVHVDFTVAQHVLASLREGEEVEVFTAYGSAPIAAEIVAIDARVDPITRNALVRARIDDGARAPAPGASVRVNVPVGPSREAVVIPVGALRKSPAGDHVFVLEQDLDGELRARTRPVESGAMQGDEVLIDAGLAPGELVAVSGSFKLHDAALIALLDVPVPASGPLDGRELDPRQPNAAQLDAGRNDREETTNAELTPVGTSSRAPSKTTARAAGAF